MSDTTPPKPDADVHASLRTLRQQLDKQPENQGIRMRLIKGYYAAGLKEDFDRESTVYKQIEMDGLDSLSVEGKAAPAGSGTGGKQKFRRFADDPVTAKTLADVTAAYNELRLDPRYLVQLDLELARVGKRPTPLLHAIGLSKEFGGAQVYLKLESLAGSEAHLTIAAVGQAHLARCLGRTRMVGGVRDIKWGLQMVSASARFGLRTEVFLDKGSYDRHSAQVYQMRLMGAQVKAVDTGDYRAGDVREAGLDAWLKRPREAFLFMGLDSGPAPYPEIGRDHTAVIGRECRRQVAAVGRHVPDAVVVRGGENTDAIGLFPAFLPDKRVTLVSVKAQPEGGRRPDAYNPFQQIVSSGEQQRMRAVLEGLEYISVSRENSQLMASGRVDQVETSTRDALSALRDMARLEGMVPGLQTAHALAWVRNAAAKMSTEQSIVLLIKEHGEQDLWDIMRLEGGKA